ncbi:activator of hsp90 ATPase 1 family protein [Colletotrichum tofieldiae]|nr:activator of hsp90 ATPase 1 family protein [Colletotrichum tofieldiae]
MGVTISQHARIEILASPSTVRSVFLDFQRYSQWQDVFQIEPITPEQDPTELKKGDRVKVNMRGFVFRPYIEENSDACLTWAIAIPPLFYGTHFFFFAQARKTQVPFWPWRNGGKPSEPWEAFNASLKAEAEKVATATEEGGLT